MNTSLIRKIIASDLPRKEQDILILLVVDYNTIDQKKRKLDDYYETEQSENESETEESETNESKSESESESENDSVKHENGYDCDDHGYNAAVRAQYEARHGRSLCSRELDAQEYSEKLVSRDDSKLWGLQFPSHTIWGNWVHSYTK